MRTGISAILPILDRAHAEAKKMADKAIAEIDALVCPNRAGSDERVVLGPLNEKLAAVFADPVAPPQPEVEPDRKRSRDNRSSPVLRPVSPLRPADNYELTEESETEGGSNKRRKKKDAPEWCKAYVAEVCRQRDWDPDTIFGLAPTCDLEAIFGKTRKHRGSSGNWEKDRLTSKEVEEYKSYLGLTTEVAGVYSDKNE